MSCGMPHGVTRRNSAAGRPWPRKGPLALDLKSKVHEDRSYQILQVNERYEGLESTWFMVEFTITGTDEDDQEEGGAR